MKYTKLTILTLFLFFAGLSFANAQGPSVENRLASNSLSLKNTITLYPNPAVEFLIIEVGNSDISDVKFEVYSLIGNKINIEPEQIGADKYRIRVKNFSSGYYFISVKDEKKRFEKTLKFLKN